MDRKAFLKAAGVGVFGLVGGGTLWHFTSSESGEDPVTVDHALKGRYRLFHRGTGANNVWVAPEHTMEGYRLANSTGAVEIDLDLRITADGVLVCHHDPDLLRSANVEADISSYTFDQLPEVDWTYTVGAGWGKQKIPAFEDVLKEFGGRVLLDVEPKDSDELPKLIDLIDRYKLKRSVIINSSDPDVIKAASVAGMYTHYWGLANTDMVDRAASAGANIVQLLYESLSAPLVDYAQAKKSTSKIEHVLCGPIQRRYERDIAFSFGVDSFVNDAGGYLDAAPQATSLAEHIAAQKVGPGWWTNYLPNDNRYVGGIMDSTGVRLSRSGTDRMRYLRLGDFCGPKASTYSLEFAWKTSGWDGSQVRPTFRFGMLDDRGDGTDASVADGYQTDMRANGEMRLLKIIGGGTDSMGSVLTVGQGDGAVANLKVYVTPSTIAVVRTDSTAATLVGEMSDSTVTSLSVDAIQALIPRGASLRLPNGQYATVASEAQAGSSTIAVEPLALTSELPSGGVLNWVLGPYADSACRGDYIWVAGSTPGNGNGSNMWLTDLVYTEGDA